jgi:hypothetical protein
MNREGGISPATKSFQMRHLIVPIRWMPPNQGIKKWRRFTVEILFSSALSARFTRRDSAFGRNSTFRFFFNVCWVSGLGIERDNWKSSLGSRSARIHLKSSQIGPLCVFSKHQERFGQMEALLVNVPFLLIWRMVH